MFAPKDEEEILVTRSEYRRELMELEAMEGELSRLREEWWRRTEGYRVVPRREFERMQEELMEMARELDGLYSERGRWLALRRWALRVGDAATAEEALVRIRELSSRIRELSRRMEEETARLRAVIPITPELEELASEMERLEGRIRYERERISRKVIANKLVAMHKRWFYASPRRGHDISVEGIASVVIDSDEGKEAYAKALESALWSAFRSQRGFDRLERCAEQQVLGFEEKLVHPRDFPISYEPRVEWLDWRHAIVKPQLSLEDFLRDPQGWRGKWEEYKRMRGIVA